MLALILRIVESPTAGVRKDWKKEAVKVQLVCPRREKNMRTEAVLASTHSGGRLMLTPRTSNYLQCPAGQNLAQSDSNHNAAMLATG